MKTAVLGWEPFFKGEIKPRHNQESRADASFILKSVIGLGTALAFASVFQSAPLLLVSSIIVADLGIAKALDPFKQIVSECADPICFVGGAMGLYRIGIGHREEGFKQVLNASIAQVGFFVWPMLQRAVRSGFGG